MNQQELARLGNSTVSLYGKDVPFKDVFLVKPPPQGGKPASPALTLNVEKVSAIAGEQIGVYTAVYLVAALLESATRIMGVRKSGEKSLLLVNNTVLDRGSIEDGKFTRLKAGDRLPQGTAQVYQANFNRGSIVAWLNSCGTSDAALKAAMAVFGVYSDAPQQQQQPTQQAFNPAGLDTEAFAAWAFEKASAMGPEQQGLVESLIDSLEGAKLSARMKIKVEVIGLIEGRAESVKPPSETEAPTPPSEASAPPPRRGRRGALRAEAAPAETTSQAAAETADEIPF